MSAQFRIQFAGYTHPGQVREHNEDNFAFTARLDGPETGTFGTWSLGPSGLMLLVADGMGGANAGEVASQIATSVIKERFDRAAREVPTDNWNEIEQFALDSLIEAHQAIAHTARTTPGQKGMGTTAVLAWVTQGRACITWSGDSRAYLFRDDQLRLITRDHSMVWEMVERGQLTPEAARLHPQNNIITQSLGDDTYPPQPEVRWVDLELYDCLLLCTDGLNTMLGDATIARIFHETTAFAELPGQLVNAANEVGGLDNITVLALDVLELPAPEPSSFPGEGQITTEEPEPETRGLKRWFKGLFGR
jgi:serine/threonine protein phosphatase PrpC